MTPREYLVKKGLAKAGRGKFSKAALEELAKARAEGIVFDEPEYKKKKPPSVPRPAAKPKKEKPKERVDAKAVRAWAKENGIEVAARGRVDATIINQYIDAMAEAGKTPEKTDENHFGDTSPRLRYNDHFTAKDLDGSKITLSYRDCCVTCGYSLGWCRCREQYTFSRVDTNQRLRLSPA